MAYINKTEKDVFRLITSVGQRKNFDGSNEESDLRPSDSALQYSTTKPQRLYHERGLFRSSYAF